MGVDETRSDEASAGTDARRVRPDCIRGEARRRSEVGDPALRGTHRAIGNGSQRFFGSVSDLSLDAEHLGGVANQKIESHALAGDARTLTRSLLESSPRADEPLQERAANRHRRGEARPSPDPTPARTASR